MNIETDLLKIKRMAVMREDENIRFMTFLNGKDSKKIDSIVHRLHKEIAVQIDCTACANCCSCMKPELSEAEIEMLARRENISKEEFQFRYCDVDCEEIYLKHLCRYIDGKKCSIYENRPEQCRTFPNTDKIGFVSRMLGMIGTYEICPIVFNLMERLKKELNFMPSRYRR